jgi:hypothetical protein
MILKTCWTERSSWARSFDEIQPAIDAIAQWWSAEDGGAITDLAGEENQARPRDPPEENNFDKLCSNYDNNNGTSNLD